MATDEERVEFGRRLRELREVAGLSADGLSERLAVDGHRVSGQSITAWERGQYVPRHRPTLEVVERALNAEGELGPIIGFATAFNAGRVEALSHEVAEVVSRLGALEDRVAALETGPSSPDQGRPRRKG